MSLNYLIFNTPLGWIGILGSGKRLSKLALPQPSPEQALYLLNEFALKWHAKTLSEAEPNYFGDLPEKIKHYLGGKPVSFPNRLDLPLASPFQKGVWGVTQSIPYGETRTYAWVAGKMGMLGATRAVGQALAKNPLPIIIPCHRVICSDGSLGGFSNGKLWKRHLLEMETRAT